MNKWKRSNPKMQNWTAAGSKASLSKTDANRLVDTAKRVAGITIDPERVDFLTSRLAKRLQATGQESFADYASFLASPGGAKEITAFTDAVTTHTTSFFREPAHFRWLEDVGFDAMIGRGAGRSWTMQIWSAACSYGQELYSAMMAAKMQEDQRGERLRLAGLGTDVSEESVARARTAVYGETEIDGLNETMRKKYLLRSRSGPVRYRIDPDVRELTTWQTANLCQLSSAIPTSDLVFLRNVLIYFDPQAQRQIVSDVVKRIRPGGFLLIGHSEALSEVPRELISVAPCIYERQ